MARVHASALVDPGAELADDVEVGPFSVVGAGVRIKALKNVTINEPFFPGHFPNYPVMPGVLIVEALAQASAIVAYRGDPEAMGGRKLFMFAGIDDARFKRQVLPGDTLILESTFLKGMRDIGRWQVRATVDGQVACEAILLSALRTVPGPQS